MHKVLITNTYFLTLDPKQERQMQPYPPLGTLYAASVLLAEDQPVTFFDNFFATGASAIFPEMDKAAGGIFIIYDDGFNYLTKMCLVNMRNACFEMIRYAIQKNCTVIISSSDATDHWETYLEIGADYILIGEAEITLKELVLHLQKGAPSQAAMINGLAYKDRGISLKTTPRAVLHDLDALPLPAWHLADIALYKNKWTAKNGYFSLNMTTTRGCPFKCNWCAKPIYGNRYNSRSADKVVSEMKMLIQQYGVEHFWFCDDIFGLKPGWIQQFSEAIQRENVFCRFKIQCRADLLLDENNIELLAKAGCDEIWIGAESGAQKILDAMDKGTTVEQIAECTYLMKKHGIKPCFFLQFGYPGENKSDIRATIDMMLHLMPHDIGISVSYPLPGTKFYEMVKNDLSIKQNWNDSDELLTMFHATYSPEYYKRLHRYVHKRFRMAQSIQGIKKMISSPLSVSKSEINRIAALPYYAVFALSNKLILNNLH